MEEQLETSSVRVRDAAVSLAEGGLRRGPLFLAIGDRRHVVRQAFKNRSLLNVG
jgi:hypothetical protein